MITYLTATASTTLDSTGQGVAVVRPDTGQYWYPRMVRVSTVSQVGPFPYCAVYQGAPTVLDPTSLIDDTFVGNIDTSTIIAGTRTQFGQAISARWQYGNPGDTAVITVYGIVSDTPILSDTSIVDTPGTHFTGRANVNVSLIPLQSVVIPAGSNVTFPTVYVGNTPFALLSLNSITSPYASFQVFLNWHDERGNFNPDVTDRFTVLGTANYGLQMMIKPKLPRLRIVVYSPTAGTPEVRISLVSAQGSPAYVGQTVLVNQSGAAVTTSTNVDPDVNYIGDAYVSCSLTGNPATWSVVGRAYDMNNTAGRQFFLADQVSGPVRQHIYIPEPRHKWIITADGVARTYNLLVVGNPYQGA